MIYISKSPYHWKTREGQSYHEMQREWIQCTECGKDLVRGSLATKRQTQNGVSRGGAGKTDDEGCGGNNPRTFRITFLENAGPRPRPVEGCSSWA